MKHAIECIGFKPMKKNTLKGFVDVSIPALNLIIRNISLHERNGGPAAGHWPGKISLGDQEIELGAHSVFICPALARVLPPAARGSRHRVDQWQEEVEQTYRPAATHGLPRSSPLSQHEVRHAYLAANPTSWLRCMGRRYHRL